MFCTLIKHTIRPRAGSYLYYNIISNAYQNKSINSRPVTCCTDKVYYKRTEFVYADHCRFGEINIKVNVWTRMAVWPYGRMAVWPL